MEDTLIQTANRFLAVEKEIEELESEKAKIQKKIHEKEGALAGIGKEIESILIENGIPNFSINGRTLYMYRRVWATLKPGDRGKICSALKRMGLGWLVAENFNMNTISAHIRELSDKDQEPPEGFTEHFEVKSAIEVRSRKVS